MNITYHKGSFSRGSNIHFKLITCKDSYVLHWYHTYLLHPVMDRTDSMIRQQLDWPNIRDSVQKEVDNCDTCQSTKQSNKKYDKLSYKLAEEIP